MKSLERVTAILNHKEADRIPFDFGSTTATSIHINAYKNLLSFLGISKDSFSIRDQVQQIVYIHGDILDKFEVDARGVSPKSLSDWKLMIRSDKEGSKYFMDQYGIEWKMPHGGLYFDISKSPLSGCSLDEMLDYPLVNPKDGKRLESLKEELINYRNEGYFVFFNYISGGFLELATWLRGFENFYIDLACDKVFACTLMDRLLDVEIGFWDLVLSELGDYVDMVYTGNDVGTQHGLAISPSDYRKYIKPRQKKLGNYKTFGTNIFVI